MIFVSGGTGFVGAHLLYDLAKKDHKVRAIKREGSSLELCKKIFSIYSEEPEKEFAKIEWFDGDMLDYFSIEKAMAECSLVYHCAGQVSFNPSEKHKTIFINEEGTKNIVDAALHHGIGKICFISSIAALGRTTKNELISEKTQWENDKLNSAYAIGKHKAEMQIWRGVAEGLKAVVVNPSIILGPGDWNKGSSELFSLINKGWNYYTEGINGYVDVRDVSRAMIQLMESDIENERFILNAENLSYKELFDMMAESLDVKKPHKKAGKRLGGLVWRLEKIRSFITGKPPLLTRETAATALNISRYDNQKIIKNIDFQFIPIRKSIEDTVRIFKK